MLESEVFVIFTLLSLAILLLKLANVLKVGDLYEPIWAIVSFIAACLSFMFIIFMVLHGAAENPELVSYLYGHTAIFVITTFLFIIETLMWFFIMLPKSPGKEKYGDRGRLTIDRRQ